MTSIRLDQNTEKRLENLAKSTGRSKSYYLRKALEKHLEELEDYYLGMQSLEESTKTYSKEEVKNELGI